MQITYIYFLTKVILAHVGHPFGHHLGQRPMGDRPPPAAVHHALQLAPGGSGGQLPTEGALPRSAVVGLQITDSHTSWPQ